MDVNKSTQSSGEELGTVYLSSWKWQILMLECATHLLQAFTIPPVTDNGESTKHGRGQNTRGPVSCENHAFSFSKSLPDSQSDDHEAERTSWVPKHCWPNESTLMHMRGHVHQEQNTCGQTKKN